MSRLDELPPDQRAALSLLLRQRKSYAELATLLGIPERAVHDRAHAALAVLAPREARELSAERRAELSDYLLGQQTGVAERLATRTFLNISEPARVWAREVSSELAPLAGDGLPEIPRGGGPSTPAPDRPPAPAARPTATASSVQPSSLAGLAASAATPAPRSSRLGGAVLLAVIVAVIVVVVLLLSGGGSSHHKSTTGASTTSTGKGSSTASTTTGPKVAQKLTLRSPNPASRSVAIVDILSEAGKLAFYIAAENLPPSKGFYYAIWLYNSAHQSEPLSKSPPVTSNKRLAGGALLPSNAGKFNEMLLTRETSSKPTHPGHVVLRGPFSLGA